MQTNDNWPEDIEDIITHFVEIEEPIGYSYWDSDLDKRLKRKMKELHISNVNVEPAQFFEDTQFNPSSYAIQVEIETP